MIKTATYLILFFTINASAAVSLKSLGTKLVVTPAAPPETGMPTWRNGQAVGEWRQIQNTSISLAPIAVVTYPPLSVVGPRSKIEAWTGLAFDSRDLSLYSAANGGHMDYAGNEVDRITLGDNAPQWTEVKPSTPAGDVIPNAAYYKDGAPTSRHTYYGIMVNEVRNSVMLLSGPRYGDGLNIGGVLDGYNMSTKNWDRFATGPSADFQSFNGWGMTNDKATGDIYVFANWSVLKWQNSSNSWSRLLANTKVYGQYAASAIDTKNKRILIIGDGAGAQNRAYYDIGSNTLTQITLSGPYASKVAAQGNGLVYDDVLEKFLLRTDEAGGNVYMIDPVSFNVTLFTNTGGSSIPTANLQPNEPASGVWGRFHYSAKLKGVIYVPRYQSNVWFLRTH